MGCIQTRKSYYDLSNVEEKHIRSWERELGAFSIDFNTIYQKICFTSNILSTGLVSKYSSELFSVELSKVIAENDYFFKIIDGNKFIDAKKVTLLYYLLSTPGLINNNHTIYNDKAYYFYLNCKNQDELDLDEAIQKDDNLKSILGSLLEVACDGFSASYFKAKAISDKGILLEIKANMANTINYIIDDLFVVKSLKVESLSFKELKDRFANDNFFFTSGYFRLKSLECLNTGSINKK